MTFGTACVRTVTILTSGGGGAGGASDEQAASRKASAAPAAQLRGRTRLIRPPEKSQLCGIVIYAKACAEGSCNLNYKKEQERGNRQLGMSESTLCKMDRSSDRKSVETGKSGSVLIDLGDPRIIKKKMIQIHEK